MAVYRGIAALSATHVAAFAWLQSRDDPAATLFSTSVSLARLGYLGPTVYAPGGPLQFLLPHLTCVFVNASYVQLAANISTLAWFGSRLAVSLTVTQPLRALLGVYVASGVAGAAFARREHLRALQGWLRISEPDAYARVIDLDSGKVLDQPGLNKALARVALDNADTRLISYAPTYGAVPATLGLAAFTALDLARSRPMYATGVLPLLATAAYLGLQDAPEIPAPFAVLNAQLGGTTFGANAAGVAVGVACFAAHRLAARWLQRAAARTVHVVLPSGMRTRRR